MGDFYFSRCNFTNLYNQYVTGVDGMIKIMCGMMYDFKVTFLADFIHFAHKKNLV